MAGSSSVQGYGRLQKTYRNRLFFLYSWIFQTALHTRLLRPFHRLPVRQKGASLHPLPPPSILKKIFLWKEKQLAINTEHNYIPLSFIAWLAALASALNAMYATTLETMLSRHLRIT